MKDLLEPVLHWLGILVMRKDIWTLAVADCSNPSIQGKIASLGLGIKQQIWDVMECTCSWFPEPPVDRDKDDTPHLYNSKAAMP